MDAPKPLLSLKELCEQAVSRSAHLNNVISLLNFAAYYSCSDLYSFALQFILRSGANLSLVTHSPTRNLDIILIQLFNSSATKFGETIWSELDVVVNEIEETLQSLQFQTTVVDPLPLPPRPSLETHRVKLDHLRSDQDLPGDISGCRKMMKQLRRYLTTATDPERSVASPLSTPPLYSTFVSERWFRRSWHFSRSKSPR
jgi:hypothetical protein